jgi:hypothetical protein
MALTVRKTLDTLAYVSLILDICIAVITVLSILGTSGTDTFLLPVNYGLTVVAVFSLALLVILLVQKVKQKAGRQRESSIVRCP